MKLQLKLIAAAALIAVAGSAAAAIPALNNSGNTGSDLLFYVYDDIAKTSYVQDLGVTYASFLSAPAAINATVGAGFATYLASVGGNTSNSYWGLVGGALGAVNYGLLNTVRVGDVAGTQTVANLKGAIGTPLLSYITGINGATPDATGGYFTNSTAADNITNNWGNPVTGTGHNAAGKLTFRTDNLIGTSSVLNLENIKTTSASVFTPITLGTASFNGTNISFAAVTAVPEPTTYAMMIAGLLLVGGIARRRNSAK